MCAPECACAECVSLRAYLKDMTRKAKRFNPCRYKDCGRSDCDFCNQRAEWEQ